MREITRVGVDLAKNVFQVHAVDAAGKVVTTKHLKRDALVPWCRQLHPNCVVAMEACGGAHYWARELMKLGLQVLLIAAHLVAPYRKQGKGGKNDANDAAAICEAASRPSMHFVNIKTAQQQAMIDVHRVRQGFQDDRIACINRIRGLLTEFGQIFPQGTQELRPRITEVIEDATNDLPGLARMVIAQACEQWRQLDEHILWCDQQIAQHGAQTPQVKQAQQVIGIGAVTASALLATVGDFKQFKNGAQFGAWLGLVPRQNSSGGKTRLGSITKHGEIYLRTLLIQGAKSAVFTAHKRSDPISQWVQRLREKSGWQVAATALANKNARIVWAMMTKGERFDARHVSVKPSSDQANLAVA